MRTKNIPAIMAILALVGIAAPAFAARAPECVKDGKKYGQVEGNFREEWYSYQERADSYMEGECFDAALSDYERAIELRTGVDRAAETPGCDKRRARTYGMHFVDWFGHRGAGIALFQLGRIDEAVKELELSLKCVESSQAQYFLDKARAKQLEKSGGDAAAPEVKNVTLVKSEPRVVYMREGAPAAPAGYDKFVAVPYYFTLEEIDSIKETLDKDQQKDKGYMKSLQPGWGNMIIAWKSADEVSASAVNEGKLYMVIESSDDQGVETVSASGIKSPYTFAQKIRADVFPVEIAAPPPSDPGADPEMQETEDLFAVPLDDAAGEVKVQIEVKDLLGKISKKEIAVKIDRDAPVIGIDEIKLAPSGSEAIIKGSIDDDSGVKGFDIGGQTPKNLGNGKFEVTVPVGPDKQIKFSAEDKLGNATSGSISVGEEKTEGSYLAPPARFARGPENPYYVASAGMDARYPGIDIPAVRAWRSETMLAQAKPAPTAAAAPPVLKMKTKDTTVYTKDVHIEGQALGKGVSVKSITINGKRALGKPQSTAIFNKLITLRPGKNLIKIQATDESGQTAEAQIVVNRIVPRVNSVAERLAVSMLPFYQDPSFVEIGEVAGDNLATSLVKQRRFNYVNRSQVQNAVREARLSGSGLTDPATAVKAGKITNAEAIIIGIVKETSTTIELQTQVVDVESSRVLITRDAFHQDKSLENLQFLANSLAAKIKAAFPMVQGNVSAADGKSYIVNIGRRNSVMPGMMVVFFKIIPKKDASGNPVGADTEKTGEGKLVAVSASTSSVQITKGSASADALIVTK